MSLVDHDHMVEALAPQGADDPLGDRVRLRCAERGEDRLDSDRARARDQVPTELGIAVADQIARVLAPGSRFADFRVLNKAKKPRAAARRSGTKARGAKKR